MAFGGNSKAGETDAAGVSVTSFPETDSGCSCRGSAVGRSRIGGRCGLREREMRWSRERTPVTLNILSPGPWAMALGHG